MDDLDRLFRHLVDTLADQSRERLEASFQVAELYQQVVPYRQHRRALGFDTHQDYEMAVLRLLAGERGYAIVEPEEVQEALVQEAEAINPDTGAFRQFAAAHVRLNPAAVRSVLEARESYAGPGVRDPGTGSAPSLPPDPDPRRPAPVSLVGLEADVETGACPHCRAPLPSHRAVNFCPFCGGNVGAPRCHQCGAALEAGWMFCGVCGQKVGRALT